MIGKALVRVTDRVEDAFAECGGRALRRRTHDIDRQRDQRCFPCHSRRVKPREMPVKLLLVTVAALRIEELMHRPARKAGEHKTVEQ